MVQKKGAVKGRSGFVDLTFTLSKIICATLGVNRKLVMGWFWAAILRFTIYLFIYFTVWPSQDHEMRQHRWVRIKKCLIVNYDKRVLMWASSQILLYFSKAVLKFFPCPSPLQSLWSLHMRTLSSERSMWKPSILPFSFRGLSKMI